MKCVIKILVLLILGSGNGSAQVPATKVPEFSFINLNKSSFTNKDLEAGKMLFFIFFDADCDHCQHAIQYIGQHHQEFQKVAVYLITLDSQEKITAFMGKYGKNLKNKKNVTILQDPKFDFMLKFKPRKYPSIFLYSAKKELIMYDDNEKNLSRFSQKINATGK